MKKLEIKEITYDGTTVFTFGSIGPHASTTEFIEMQTNGTFHFEGITINAIVENITNSFIGMGKETIFTWTEFGGLWFF